MQLEDPVGGTVFGLECRGGDIFHLVICIGGRFGSLLDFGGRRRSNIEVGGEVNMDLRDRDGLLLLPNALWEIVKCLNCRGSVKRSGAIRLRVRSVPASLKSDGNPHTAICAQRVTWNIVIALWVPSDATQHHGRCSSAHRNLRFKICNVRVCSIVKEDFAGSITCFFLEVEGFLIAC